MTGSALRRNVAELLGIATAREIKRRAYQPTLRDAAEVNEWLDACEIAWIACDSPARQASSSATSRTSVGLR